MKSTETVLRALAMALVTAWAMTGAAMAASTWGGGGSNSNWSTAGNWDAAPASGADVVFGTGGSYAEQDIAFTVGNVTFNRTGGFYIGSAANNTLTISSNISVSAAETYGIWRASGSPTIDVAAGGKVATSNTLFNGFVKTGTGEYGVRIPNGAWGYNEGAVIVKEGTVQIWKGGYGHGLDVRSLIVSNGARVVSSDTAGLGFYGNGESTILGKLGDTGQELAAIAIGGDVSAPTVVFGGAEGRFLEKDNYWVWANSFNRGLWVFSNSTVNVDNRVTNILSQVWQGHAGGKMLLLGNDSSDSVQEFRNYTFGNGYGLPKLEVLHGASASATINILNGYQGSGNADWIARNGLALRVQGSGLGAASTPRSVVKLGTMLFSGWYAGPYCTNTAIPFVSLATNEFARHDSVRGTYAYEGTRLNNFSGATTNEDVLITSPQTLGGNVAAASVKIDGAQAIDLGGNTLTLGLSGFGGAILQTGANNPVGISNGTIQVTQGANGYGKAYLYVQGDRDLTISAAVNAAGITKVGTGKLTLFGDTSTLSPPGGYFPIRWLEGGLELNTSNDFTLGTVYTWPFLGVEPNASLIKRGTNTVSLGDNNYQNYSTGGVTVAQGTLVGGRFGYGPLTIQQGAMAILSNSAHWFVPSKIVLDGGTLYTRGGYGYPFYSCLFSADILRGGTPPVLEVPAGKTGTVYMAKDEPYSCPGDNYVYNPAGAGTLRFAGPGRAVFAGQIAASPFTGVVSVGPRSTVLVGYYAGWQIPHPWLFYPTNAAGFFTEATNSFIYNQYCESGLNGLLSYGGFGRFTTGYGGYTLNCAGGRWTPGNGKTAGILSVDVNLNLARLNGTNSVIEIDVTGTGTTPGTDNDELVVDNLGAGGPGLAGLNATPANATVDLLVRTDPKKRGISGNTYTIVKAPNNFQGLQFGRVTWATPGSSGTVNCNTNGTITLTGVYGGYTMEGTTFVVR